LQCLAVRCSVLQCVAVRCSVLQCVAVCCSVLQCVANECISRSVLQCVAVSHSVLPCVAVCRSVIQCDAMCCKSVYQSHCVAVCVASEALRQFESLLQRVAVCVVVCVAVLLSVLQGGVSVAAETVRIPVAVCWIVYCSVCCSATVCCKGIVSRKVLHCLKVQARGRDSLNTCCSMLQCVLQCCNESQAHDLIICVAESLT